MKDYYNVIIIGAGPAGLSCASELERSNKSVLVLEKQRGLGLKVCAGGITSKINKTFLSLDTADILFSSAKINCVGESKTIQALKPFVGTIDRARLAKLIQQKLTPKTEIALNTGVTEITQEYIKTTDNQKIKYDFLVGAEGSNSLVRNFLKLKQQKTILGLQYRIPQKYEKLELFFEPKLFGSGYAWIFPHQSYTLIGCGTSQKIYKTNLKENFESWLKKNNISTKGLPLEANIINFDFQGFAFENIFLAGDAAGFTSGLTGEGIYFALISGKEVAKKIINPNYNCPEIKNILKLKKQHERILVILNFLVGFNPLLAEIFVKSLLPLIDIPSIKNKIINKIS